MGAFDLGITGAIGDRGANPVLRRLREVFVEWGVLARALAPRMEHRAVLSALQAGWPSGHLSPTGVFVLPKASLSPSPSLFLSSLSSFLPPLFISIYSLFYFPYAVHFLSDAKTLSVKYFCEHEKNVS